REICDKGTLRVKKGTCFHGHGLKYGIWVIANFLMVGWIQRLIIFDCSNCRLLVTAVNLNPAILALI
ncbi:hypothetical protein A2U01_0038448, partial [Trifolium medium]|nr:hypothetical protein [Trifolium medium]